MRDDGHDDSDAATGATIAHASHLGATRASGSAIAPSPATDATLASTPGTAATIASAGGTMLSQIDTARVGAIAGATAELALVDPARYFVGDELARGGLGRILRGRDKHLGRPVAIKELLHESEDLARRFAREALVTARLMHPAIVPVYDAGRWPTGMPFYAMKLVSGRSLDEVIRDAPVFRDRLALLSNVIAVAEAIAYAHSEGIIHRDLKPANVLVGSFGETVVIDWGLAKDLKDSEEPPPMIASSGDSGATLAGSVLGTPSYMPPEQAMGDPVDARADVYALGALLYHVLAGQAPYVGPTADAVLARVLAAPPPPLAAEEVPAELATIVGKAMARAAAERYADAGELAADLKRFQTGQLVSAHTYTTRALVRRWIAKRRAVVTVAAIAAVALAGVGGYSIHRVMAERETAIARADDMTIAQARAMLAQDPSASIQALASLPVDAPAAKWALARGVAAEARDRGIARRELALGPGAAVAGFLPDGRVLAYDHASIYAWRTGAVTRLADMPANGRSLILSPDGTTIAAWIHRPDDHDGVDDRVALLDAATGRMERSVAAQWLETLAFTPDSKRLILVAGDFSTIAVADGAQRHVALATQHVHDSAALAVARDGSFALLATNNDVTRCDLSELACTILPGVVPDQTAPTAIAINAPGTHALLAGRTFVRSVDLVTNEWSNFDRTEESRIAHLGLSLDGRYIVGTAERRGMLYLFDLRHPSPNHWDTGTQLGPLAMMLGRAAIGTSNGVLLAMLANDDRRWLRGQRDQIQSLAVRDTQLASASADDTVRLWDVATPALPCGLPFLTNLVFSRDRKVALVHDDVQLVVCDVATDRARTVAPAEPLIKWTGSAIAPDGRRAAALVEGGIAVVDLATGAVRRIATTPYGEVAWSDAGVIGLRSDSIEIWPPDLGASRTVATFHPDKLVVLAPDARHYVTEDAEAQLPRAAAELRDLSSTTITQIPSLFTFELSPSGERIAGAVNGRLRIIASATGAVSEPDDRVTVERTLWSPDSVALASSDGQVVRLWNLQTREHRILLRVTGHGGVRDLAFSPDGGRLAVIEGDGTVVLIDAPTAETRVLGTLADARKLVFWPDGKTIATVGDRATVMWSDDLPADPHALHAWLASQVMGRDQP